MVEHALQTVMAVAPLDVFTDVKVSVVEDVHIAVKVHAKVVAKVLAVGHAKADVPVDVMD